MSIHLAPAILMIIIASWIFYRYAAPKRSRDWTGAGLVQAFIISLYAEMFGFPLTLYVVTRLFGWDAAWLGQTQPLWATAFRLNPGTWMLVFMGIGNLVMLTGLIILIDGWRQVYKAREGGLLATGGIYARVRHPQYVGLILMVFGEGVIHWPTIISLTLFPLIVAAYAWLAFKEEKELLQNFGQAYKDYQKRVPMLVPLLRPAKLIEESEPRQKTRV